MRARWLKPEFFKDRKIGALGPVAALVYESLWCLADDGGVAPCDPEVLKGEMFVHWPSVGLPSISEALRQLYTAQRIQFFQGSDELFARIINFERHQKVHNPSKHRNALQYNDFREVLPQWCGSPAAGLPPSSPPRHLDSYTPRHLDTETPGSLELSETASKPEVVDVVMEFECVGAHKQGVITAQHVAQWSIDFPGVDVMAELRRMRSWLEANPTNRKTARGLPRFIVSWLGKTQDRSGRSTPFQPRLTAAEITQQNIETMLKGDAA